MFFRFARLHGIGWALLAVLMGACEGSDGPPSGQGGATSGGASVVSGAAGTSDGGRATGGTAGAGGITHTGGMSSASGGSGLAGGGGGSSDGGQADAGNAGAGVGDAGAGGEAGSSGDAGAPGSGGANGQGGQGGAGGSAGSAGNAAGAGGVGGSVEACPSVSSTTTVSEFDADGLVEASGLAASREMPGVFYAHNDSGSPPYVFAVNEDGEQRATLELTGALNQDWEDIAVGPGPTSGASYIYVADTGDNDLVRTTSVLIERFLEPDLASVSGDANVMVDYDTIYLHYPDGAHNAETLLVDPDTADLYLITKGDAGGSRVYVAAAPHTTTAIITLSYLGSLSFGTAPLSGSALATSGSVAPDGSAALIRTYDTVFLFARAPGQSLADALFATPCAFAAPEDGQGEGISFGANAHTYFTLGEGSEPPLHRVVLSSH